MQSGLLSNVIQFKYCQAAKLGLLENLYVLVEDISDGNDSGRKLLRLVCLHFINAYKYNRVNIITLMTY